MVLICRHCLLLVFSFSCPQNERLAESQAQRKSTLEDLQNRCEKVVQLQKQLSDAREKCDRLETEKMVLAEGASHATAGDDKARQKVAALETNLQQMQQMYQKVMY